VRVSRALEQTQSVSQPYGPQTRYAFYGSLISAFVLHCNLVSASLKGNILAVVVTELHVVWLLHERVYHVPIGRDNKQPPQAIVC